MSLHALKVKINGKLDSFWMEGFNIQFSNTYLLKLKSQNSLLKIKYQKIF
jgi:hypothetical protein